MGACFLYFYIVRGEVDKMSTLQVDKPVNIGLHESVLCLRFREALNRLHEIGFTDSDIARFLGVSRFAVYCWRNGQRRPRDLSVIYRLEQLLEANVEKLTDEYFSRSHNTGENFFSFEGEDARTLKELKRRKKIHGAIRSLYCGGDPPVLRSVLASLTRVGGVLNVSKLVLDDAALMIRKLAKTRKLVRSEAEVLALAALKVASLRCQQRFINEAAFKQMVQEAGEELYQERVAELAKMFLA